MQVPKHYPPGTLFFFHEINIFKIETGNGDLENDLRKQGTMIFKRQESS